MKRRSRSNRFLSMHDEEPDDPLNAESLPGSRDNSYTWTYGSQYAFKVGAFVTQAYLRKISHDCLELGACRQAEFEFDYARRALFVVQGNLAFSSQDRLFHYQANAEE